jgi:exosortase A-associated hydrolase 2
MPAVPPFEAFFLPVEDPRPGQRFCIFHPAQGGTTLGSVLYIHPFAEEMNKSRRMAALQSRALAQAGYAVLQIDLLGCGDSSGDFGDATWQEWVDDALRGCAWLQRRSNAPVWLWGLRAGCLLAAESALRLDSTPNFIFWAPTPSGKLILQQFLRLKAAADMLAGGAKGVVDGLRKTLAAGKPVEIAGYILAPGLAQGLEQALLAEPVAIQVPASPRIEWFEMSTQDDAVLSPLARKTIAQLEERGFTTRSHFVAGPSFWQTAEIEDAPALVAATVSAVFTAHQTQAAAA